MTNVKMKELFKDVLKKKNVYLY